MEDQLSNIELQRTIDHIKNTLLRKTSKQTIPSWVVETLEEGDPDRFLSSPFHLAQTYSISKTADILSEYCVNNDTSYDLVFRFRFDNFMELKTDEYRSKIFKDMDTLIKEITPEAKELQDLKGNIYLQLGLPYLEKEAFQEMLFGLETRFLLAQVERSLDLVSILDLKC